MGAAERRIRTPYPAAAPAGQAAAAAAGIITQLASVPPPAAHLGAGLAPAQLLLAALNLPHIQRAVAIHRRDVGAFRVIRNAAGVGLQAAAALEINSDGLKILPTAPSDTTGANRTPGH